MACILHAEKSICLDRERLEDSSCSSPHHTRWLCIYMGTVTPRPGEPNSSWQRLLTRMWTVSFKFLKLRACSIAVDQERCDRHVPNKRSKEGRRGGTLSCTGSTTNVHRFWCCLHDQSLVCVRDRQRPHSTRPKRSPWSMSPADAGPRVRRCCVSRCSDVCRPVRRLWSQSA